MTDINLLPPIQKQKRLALSIVAYLTIGFLALLISAGGFALTLTTIQITTNEKINQYDNQITTLERQIKTYSALEADVTNINKNLRLVDSVLKEKLSPNDIVDLISTKISADTVATTISIDKPEASSGEVSITVTGKSTERSSVIQLKRALQESAGIKNVTYTIASADTKSVVGNLSSYPFSFSMNVIYVPTNAKEGLAL